MHNTIRSSVLAGLLATSGFASAEAINIQPDRYIERLDIVADWNEGEASGTVITQPVDCPTCAPVEYPVTGLAEVRFKGKRYPASALSEWRRFRGDIVISKRDERIVAVIRSK